VQVRLAGIAQKFSMSGEELEEAEKHVAKLEHHPGELSPQVDSITSLRPSGRAGVQCYNKARRAVQFHARNLAMFSTSQLAASRCSPQ
jgi:hypothetical protein